MAEIITEALYEDYEKFVSTHHNGDFCQSIKWPKVKNNWDYEAIISRNDSGDIVGSMLILIQKIPYFNTSFLYSPRGPVCDWHDESIIADLISGVNNVAKKYNAHAFKMDPEVLISDDVFIDITKKLGFSHFTGGVNFETIQSRFNYRLYLQNRTEDEIFQNFTSKTRYNIRVAKKHSVDIRVCGLEFLDDFMSLMKITGYRDGFNIRPKSYFERMLDVMGPNIRLYIAFYNDKPISGAITTNYAGTTSYVYGASDNEYRNVMPNYLIQWHMIKWAIETNCDVYDFKGVSGDIDNENNPLYGLYRFKKGFNGSLDEFAGEFNLIFKPFTNKIIDMSINIKNKIAKRG